MKIYFLRSENKNLSILDVICDPGNSSAENTSECPKDSQCIDIKGYGKHLADGKNHTEGLCSCKPNFMVNRKFNSSDNASIYCIEREDSHSTTTVAPSTASPPTTLSTSTTKAPDTTVKPSTTSSTTAAPQKPTDAPKVDTTTAKGKSEDIVDVKPAPEPPGKGFFGSILVPVMIVLGLIGVTFVGRKYNVIDRTRNYVRNRGGQQHQVGLNEYLNF